MKVWTAAWRSAARLQMHRRDRYRPRNREKLYQFNRGGHSSRFSRANCLDLAGSYRLSRTTPVGAKSLAVAAVRKMTSQRSIAVTPSRDSIRQRHGGASPASPSRDRCGSRRRRHRSSCALRRFAALLRSKRCPIRQRVSTRMQEPHSGHVRCHNYSARVEPPHRRGQIYQDAGRYRGSLGDRRRPPHHRGQLLRRWSARCVRMPTRPTISSR